MAEKRHGWLAAPNVSWTWVLLASLVWAGALLAAYRSGLGLYLESRLARPLDFQTRTLLHRDPVVSPKLKIYSIDDSTFAKLGSWVLSLDEWAAVLATLDSSQPRGIFIDAMFSKADALNGETAEGLAKLAKIKTPITVGSFVTPAPIKYREPLDLDRPEYSLAGMTGVPAGSPVPNDRLPPIPDRRNWYAFGPAKELRQVFRFIGHFAYQGFGVIPPLIRMSDNSVIGHLSLYLAQERRIEQGKLILDGATVPVDAGGELVINFPPPKAFETINMSMRGLLNRALNGQASKVVEKGDVVLILPHMYTGNTDFTQTPFGAAPGGLVIASMLNSVLTGQWLKPLAGGEVLVVALVLAGALLGMKAGAVTFWLTLILSSLGSLALTEYLFAWHGIVVPWLFPLAGYVGAGVSVFAEKTRVGEKKVQTLRAALEGSVAPDELKSILKRPERISFEARERVVTLMFIDVVGFSLLAENMLPRMAFENLKKMLSTIGETIHSFGGIIDKTLGDGLLCYFGYRFDEDSSNPDHAEQALRCGIKIQRDNLMRNLEAAENGEPVYPLRIGINTASCYLGDLGSQSRIDFTVVGNGVNFAKRLEGACEMHSVLFGATTNDLVKGIGLPTQAMTKRFVRIKHHSELVEAYEYDPFYDQPELRMAALEGFRKCANIERVDQRWPVHDSSKIQLMCDFGVGILVNFSHTGISVKLPQLLAKGTRLNITLDGGQGALKALLAKEGITILQGEVRWGYAEGAEFVHGVLITNINDAQSDYLVQYLCEFAFSRDATKDKDGEAKGANQKAS